MKNLFCVIVSAVLVTFSAGSFAQDFPNRRVTLEVGFGAGGATDVVARILAQKLGDEWNQPVIVVNRTGASGTLATDFVAKSAPDGYTMLVTSPTSTAAAPGMFPRLPYNVVKDFVVITEIATTPFLLVVPVSSSFKTFGDLIEYAKAHPSELSYGSGGLGAQGQLATELLNQWLHLKVMHVPYKGESGAFTDLVSGRLSFMFVTLGAAIPLIDSGKLRALAVSSLERSEFAKDIPTIAELGFPGFETESWNALYAPSSMPASLVARINEDVVKVLKMPETIALFRQQAFKTVGNSSAQATAYLKSETEKWGGVIKAANIGAK